MKRVLILGASGMLGHRLARELSNRFNVYATIRAKALRSLAELDWYSNCHLVEGVEATHFETVAEVLTSVRPNEVINAIGLIKQRPEAKDPILCLEVNALFPHRLANACEAVGARLIHVSTDCVFSGKRGNYSESDIPDPVDMYDRSKLLGEAAHEGVLTLRTSLIGRELERTTGLIEWFLSQRSRTVNGFTRAIFSGLSTFEFAQVIAQVIQDHPDLKGLFHVASDPISKFEMLDRLRSIAGLDIKLRPVAEPAVDKSLNGDEFARNTGIRIANWSEMLQEIASEIARYDVVRAHSEQVLATSESDGNFK